MSGEIDETIMTFAERVDPFRTSPSFSRSGRMSSEGRAFFAEGMPKRAESRLRVEPLDVDLSSGWMKSDVLGVGSGVFMDEGEEV